MIYKRLQAEVHIITKNTTAFKKMMRMLSRLFPYYYSIAIRRHLRTTGDCDGPRLIQLDTESYRTWQHAHMIKRSTPLQRLLILVLQTRPWSCFKSREIFFLNASYARVCITVETTALHGWQQRPAGVKCTDVICIHK